MKRIAVLFGTLAVSAGIALGGAGQAAANPDWCASGPFGHVSVCWQPWWGWNNWNHGHGHWDNHHDGKHWNKHWDRW